MFSHFIHRKDFRDEICLLQWAVVYNPLGLDFVPFARTAETEINADFVEQSIYL